MTPRRIRIELAVFVSAALGATIYAPWREPLALIAVITLAMIGYGTLDIAEDAGRDAHRALVLARHPISFAYQFRFEVKDAGWEALGVTADERARLPSMPTGFVMELWAGPSEMRRFRVLECVGGRLEGTEFVRYEEDFENIELWYHKLDDGSQLTFFLHDPGGHFEIIFGRHRAGTFKSYGSLPMEFDGFGPFGGTCALFKVTVLHPSHDNRASREESTELEQRRLGDDSGIGHDVYESDNDRENAYWWRLEVRDLRPSRLATVVRVKRSLWRREPRLTSLRLDDGRRMHAWPEQIERVCDGRVVPRKSESVFVGFDESFSHVARVWLTGQTADGKKV